MELVFDKHRGKEEVIMGLFIACILIYQFEMHWGFYVAAVVLSLVRVAELVVLMAVDENIGRIGRSR